ncbi:MAG: cell division protein SepF [Clostridia bacterium]|nr:cell division protein SepF [Clostridia bacterium]
MAFADFFTNVKNKAAQMYSNFFYAGKDVPAAPRQERSYASQEPAPPRQFQDSQQQYQPYYGDYQYQQPYQQQYQPSYQQQMSGQASQPQQPFQYGQPEQQPQQRSHRAVRQNGNVFKVDFGDNQQQPQQPAAQPVQESASLLNARIINARGMGDCRSAITLLRNGDAVLVVMENITNPGDMRRLVDTLSGACYSLTATITKVSRYGVYLLAPQTIAVFADQATNQMNAGPARGQAQRYQPNAYAPQQPMYTNPLQQPAQQPQAYSQQQQQEFTQRVAAPQEAAREFYQRPMPQEAGIPSFSTQPAASGYTPDEHTSAVAQ